jgi:hypothetical protein
MKFPSACSIGVRTGTFYVCCEHMCVCVRMLLACVCVCVLRMKQQHLFFLQVAHALSPGMGNTILRDVQYNKYDVK